VQKCKFILIKVSQTRKDKESEVLKLIDEVGF
jgi:hypothetical protein